MIELKSRNLTALISPIGASLNGFWIKGHSPSLVLGAVDPVASAQLLPYFGSVVGPVANRISNSTVLIDGETWRICQNDGTIFLHNGPHGLHAQNWTVSRLSADQVTLQFEMPHGADGLPGNRVFQAQYALVGDSALRLTLVAQSDRTTLMNLTHHPYWNLDGEQTIARHSLEVAADTYLPVDDQTLPTGQIKQVSGSAYDFRTTRPIPTEISLDANFCLAQAPRSVAKKAAVLSNPNGLTLQIDTTEPGLQIYNGSGLQPSTAKLYGGRRLVAFAGVALEPQRWPDAPSNANFPSIVLPAFEQYRQVTEYKISY